jgi:hypothetical protein
MRRDRYLENFERHILMLQKLAMASGISYDDAREVVSQCIEELLFKKKYVSVRPSKLKGFLRAHLRFRLKDYAKEQIAKTCKETRLPDLEDKTVPQHIVSVLHEIEVEPVVQECPFCFRNDLNEYGACSLCHTIVPSHVLLQRKYIAITEESLACEFDFHTALDIQKAVSQLTLFEQRVVNAVILGNETLESFAFDSAYSRQSLTRVWAVAKQKLQVYLAEYNSDGLS